MPKRQTNVNESEVNRLHTKENLSPSEIATVLKTQIQRIKKILISQGVRIDCWCGIEMKEHIRCAGCGILVGPKHLTTIAEEYKDKKFCQYCAKGRKKRGRLI